jgi:hypothetical protein
MLQPFISLDTGRSAIFRLDAQFLQNFGFIYSVVLVSDFVSRPVCSLSLLFSESLSALHVPTTCNKIEKLPQNLDLFLSSFVLSLASWSNDWTDYSQLGPKVLRDDFGRPQQ